MKNDPIEGPPSCVREATAGELQDLYQRGSVWMPASPAAMEAAHNRVLEVSTARDAHQLINQDSGDTEWYTPPEIVEAARLTLGGVIDLDPASSLIANQRIRATKIFTITDDGLRQQWHGRVWMNHPFSAAGNPVWVRKLVEEYEAGRVVEACCICFAATSERWFQPLAVRPQCYMSPRTNYYLPDGTKKPGVTKGSVVTYFGPNPQRFADAFRRFGVVKAAI
jgi:ParB family chromosome partitioning protein